MKEQINELLVLFPVNRIKEQYKVSVRIPQDSERCGLVRIEGDPQGVQLARKELMDMAQRMVRRSIWKSQEHSAYEIRNLSGTFACMV